MARLTIPMQVTQERIDRYGKANGDAEKLHYDADFARRSGYRGTIAHGTLLIAPLFDLALKRFGPEFLSAGSLCVEWTAPVCAGDLQLASIDDDGRIEAVIDSMPERPVTIRGESSCGGQAT